MDKIQMKVAAVELALKYYRGATMSAVEAVELARCIYEFLIGDDNE